MDRAKGELEQSQSTVIGVIEFRKHLLKRITDYTTEQTTNHSLLVFFFFMLLKDL